MDDIVWLDEQKSAEFKAFLADLKPNGISREEFEKIIAERYGEIISSEENGFMFHHLDEAVKVSFSKDGIMTVLAHKTGSDELYIPQIAEELVLLYGVSETDMAEENNAAFIRYQAALLQKKYKSK